MTNLAVLQFDGSVVYSKMQTSEQSPKSASIGYLVKSYTDGLLGEGGRCIGTGVDSEIAEYHALLEGVQCATEAVGSTVELSIQGDAQSVLDCCNPNHRAEPTRPLSACYVEEIQRRLRYFDSVRFKYIARSSNATADGIASQQH